VRVVAPAVAAEVARMMRAVVREGTGTGAALPDVGVAGKTGTAELGTTVPPPSASSDPAAPPPDVPETTAWFTAFAPLREPRAAVGVLLAEAGAGGDVAAPVAREVLRVALAPPRRDR
jgi:cell division protein FtsI/penicillin-binding protein 2